MLRGVRPRTSNWLIRFLCRPSSEVRLADAPVYFLLVCVGFAALILVVLAPTSIAAHIDKEGSRTLMFAYAGLCIGFFTSRGFGRKLWQRLA